MSLQKLIDAQREASFTDPSTATNEQALGLLVSKYFSWDGLSILKTAMFALEDANFHSEAGLIDEMIKKEEAR